VLRRLAGRLLTGPIAFFLAGVIDVGAFASGALRESVRKRLPSVGSETPRLRRDESSEEKEFP
jgi:hypothetical protein